MSDALQHFALGLLNFSSVLSLKHENGSFKLSRVTEISNVLKLPFIVVLTALAAFFDNVLGISEEPKVSTDVKSFSNFSRLLIPIVLIVLVMSSMSLYVIQFRQRHNIEHFLNQLQNLQISPVQLVTLIADSKKVFLGLGAIFLFTFVITTVKELSWTFLSVSSIVGAQFGSLTITFLIALIKIVEMTLIASLRTLKEKVLANKNLQMESYLEVARAYQQIFHMSQQFNEFLGLQLTILVLAFTMAIVINVSST